MQMCLIYFHTEASVHFNTPLTCDLFVMWKPSRSCIFVFALFFRLGRVFKKCSPPPFMRFIQYAFMIPCMGEDRWNHLDVK